MAGKNYYTEGYRGAYGHISWSGKFSPDADVEQFARDYADGLRIPDGEPKERYVAGFVDYVNTH